MWGAIAISFNKMIESISNAFITSKEHQLDTSIVKEDKRQEKALKSANIIIDLILTNIECLPTDAQKIFYKQKKIFDKNIT